MTGRAIFTSARWARVALMLAGGLGCCSWSAASDDTATAPEKSDSKPAALRIVAIRAGFAGQFKVGCWTPFEIELEGGNQAVTGHVELVAPDGDGVPSRVHAPAGNGVSIGPGERKTVALYAKLGQLASDVTVGFRGPEGLVVEKRLSTQTNGPLAGVLPSGETLLVSVGFGAAADNVSAKTLRGVHEAHLDGIEQLPGDWWGYEGVDVVMLATGDDEISSQLSTASRQLAALELWVRMGGKLIVSVGRQAEKVLAAGSPLAELAPGKLDAVVPLRQGTMLESYADANEPLSADGRFEFEVPKLRDVRGKVEAFVGTSRRDLPLVIRAPRGFGEVVFVAFDLERPPLANWRARPQFVEKLLRRESTNADQQPSGPLGAVTTLGFVDLAGQLRGALDQFSGVRLVPFWLVVVLVTAYIVCIGPLDYYLVKRVFRRMEATWFSFAVTVLVFSAGAAALAYGLKARQLRVNQVDLVDFDVESGLQRGTSWSYVYSPANNTYDFSLRPDGASVDSGGAGMLFSWFGLPGGGFGGMDVAGGTIGGADPAASRLRLFNEAYDFSGRLNAVARVPIAVWSSKSFVSRWWRHAAPRVEAKLADDGRLVGTLRSHLEYPLTGVVLIYDKWAYVIRELAPGDRIDFASDIDPQTVVTYLRHVTARGDRQIAVPYDRASFDIPRIVEIMTAHDLAGGENYTELSNQYQGFVEMSDLVRSGRAVLFARGAKPAAQLLRDGEPIDGAQTESWTFYRFVFPVANQADDERSARNDG